MALVLGIDPGAKGAAVAITEAAGRFVSACPASWDGGSLAYDVFDWLDGLGLVDAAAIEEPVMAFRDGEPIHKSSTAVAISVGQWKGMMAAVGIRHVKLVPPRSWQAKVIGKIEKGQSKSASIRWALMVHGQAIAPAIQQWGDAVSDAAGIAEWRRLQLAEERQRDRAMLAEARRG